jgi:DNA polymerase-4
MERSIIHLNIADFAAAVEANDTPRLGGYPIIIAPTGSPRAVVYDMSDQAYKEGIRKGMPLARARRINKTIKIIPPRFNRYEQVMKDLFKQSLAYTPAIESGHWDGHIFLDVSGTRRLFGPPVDVAFRLKKEIIKKLGLDPIWSVATNKLVAKVATRMVKPAGEYIVAPGEEEAFLEPLPITLLPGLSKADITTLNTFNLVFISQIRLLTTAQLSVPFAHRAGQIHRLVRGIDTTPVTGITEKDGPIQANHEFANDTNDADQLRKALYLLVETLCTTLRRRHRAAGQLSITLSYSDGRQRTATAKLSFPTANEMTLFRNATPLLSRAWTRRIRIRHLGLTCKKPARPETQATLFAETTREERQEKIFKVVDKIRAKFGTHAVGAGLTLAKPSTISG